MRRPYPHNGPVARAKQEQIEWSTFGGDLFLALDRDTGLRDGIEAALRGAIADGRRAAGTRLPSTRVLARDLGVPAAWSRRRTRTSPPAAGSSAGAARGRPSARSRRLSRRRPAPCASRATTS